MNLHLLYNPAAASRNKLEDWLIAALLMVLSYFILQFLKRLTVHQLQKLTGRTRTDIDGFFVHLLGQTKSALLLVFSIYLGSLRLSLSASLTHAIRLIALFALLLQIGFWINALINYWVQRQAGKKDTAGSEATTLNVVGVILKIAAWVLLILLALDNLPGVEITALIASLGIGGIAVGLALQSILSDLFASVTIALDKPFVIGDSIVVGDQSGTVEHVGLKSVRVRALSGEQIIYSTSDLLASRIHNFQKMETRRVVLKFGVTYQTPQEHLARIPTIMEEIISSKEKTTFVRSHFTGFGASALEYETVFNIESPDYTLFMDIRQAIGLEIIKRFEEHGIEFAYPTQTLLIESNNKSDSSQS